ncbi:MAG: hypothetical protein Q9227_007441 [Pyrenula ochraceoflavens]
MTMEKVPGEPKPAPSIRTALENQPSFSPPSFPKPQPQNLPTVLPFKSPSQWNSRHLGLRLAADATSALSASALIAPLICLIDSHPFRACFLRAVQTLRCSPSHFLTSKPFLLILTLYTSTYLTANTIDTLTSTLRPSSSFSSVHSGPSKFLGVSAVNMSLCVYKDSQFAKLFASTPAPASRIPAPSYALFALRDSLTILASFNLPPLLSPHLSHISRLSTESRRQNAAQFIAPAAMQILSTPLHLLGLDLYNRQGQRLSWAERYARVKRDWAVSALARMGRIVPAFGVGGVVNAGVRRRLMGKLEE